MIDALPETGVPAGQILAELRELRAGDLPTHGGRLFAYVYDPALDGLDELARAAHAISAHVNGLDPTAFPSLLAMENAIVGAAARLLNAPATAVGNVTSGGTESILLAVKAARDSRPADAARVGRRRRQRDQPVDGPRRHLRAGLPARHRRPGAADRGGRRRAR